MADSQWNGGLALHCAPSEGDLVHFQKLRPRVVLKNERKLFLDRVDRKIKTLAIGLAINFLGKMAKNESCGGWEENFHHLEKGHTAHDKQEKSTFTKMTTDMGMQDYPI